MPADVYAEINSILAPVKTANPGISNGDIVDHLPQRLRAAFWQRAVERYLAEETANLEAKP